MKSLTRRAFAGRAGASLLAALSPHVARGQANPRVVVIGGGIGGATVARYLASSAPAIDVTLVEPKERYITCFFSSLYLAGLRSLDSLSHGYETLAQRYGVNVIHESAAAIDPVAKTVALESGTELAYDRLVLAPGVAFKFGGIEGYDEAAAEVMPHAWNAGPQSELLRRQLENMEDGGVFAIAVPPDPFRCPPAPYERASLVAYYFKQYKPKSKVLILDAKDAFKPQDVFEEAWARHYPGMIEWLPAQFTGGVKAVDTKTLSVITEAETFKVAVANVIPAQSAGVLAQQTGLTGETGWCPVDPLTFESTLQPGHPSRRQFHHRRRHAEIRLLRQQPGQGLCLRHRGGAYGIAALPAAPVQFLLYVPCPGRRLQQRAEFPARRGDGQDHGGEHLRQQGRRER